MFYEITNKILVSPRSVLVLSESLWVCYVERDSSMAWTLKVPMLGFDSSKTYCVLSIDSSFN